jgi:hypothetical protein
VALGAFFGRGGKAGRMRRLRYENYFQARKRFEYILLSSDPKQRSDELRLSRRITSG